MKEKTERVGVLSPDTLGSPLTLKPSTDEVRKAAFSKRTKWILKEKCQTGDATYQWIEWDNQGNVRETLNLESRACFITEVSHRPGMLHFHHLFNKKLWCFAY